MKWLFRKYLGTYSFQFSLAFHLKQVWRQSYGSHCGAGFGTSGPRYGTSDLNTDERIADNIDNFVWNLF